MSGSWEAYLLWLLILHISTLFIFVLEADYSGVDSDRPKNIVRLYILLVLLPLSLPFIAWKVYRYAFLSSCKHLRIRCIHGDEINFRNGNRSLCLDCGKSLPVLPARCSITETTHFK